MSLPAPAATEYVEVEGCRIAYRRSGPTDAPAVLLIHGGAAHSGWWRGVAPRLGRSRQVVLVDLSGHGESGHRPGYTGTMWGHEIVAVLGRVTDAPAVVVGHSMGGLVGIATAARAPERVEALVLVDSRLPLRGLPAPTRPVRLFASDTEALDRFRLLPERTNASAETLREVAREGLIEVEGGWRWKFDPGARRRLTNDGVNADLAAIRCPVGYIYGADSDMGGIESLRHLESALGLSVPSEAIPGAFHHVPLDQPEACADGIDQMIRTLSLTR